MGNIAGGYYPGSIPWYRTCCAWITKQSSTQMLLPSSELHHVTAQAPRDTVPFFLFERRELGSPVEI